MPCAHSGAGASPLRHANGLGVFEWARAVEKCVRPVAVAQGRGLKARAGRENFRALLVCRTGHSGARHLE
eukprot:2362330-Alexandrium_andersonii.AAC.1